MLLTALVTGRHMKRFYLFLVILNSVCAFSQELPVGRFLSKCNDKNSMAITVLPGVPYKRIKYEVGDSSSLVSSVLPHACETAPGECFSNTAYFDLRNETGAWGDLYRCFNGWLPLEIRELRAYDDRTLSASIRQIKSYSGCSVEWIVREFVFSRCN